MATQSILKLPVPSPILMVGIKQFDPLNQCLAKAVALTDVATNSDLSNSSIGAIHNYLVTLYDLVTQAQLLCEQLRVA